MLNSNNLALLALLLSTLPGLAQFGQGVAAGSWEPLAIRTKAGIVADWNPAMSSTVTLNGQGISALANRVPGGNALTNATAANQPLISRTDNSGNLLVQSETFATTWARTRINAFGATDTGAAGAGSFANTARTTDPFGGNTADFIQEDGTASNTHYLAQTVNGAPGSYVLSVSGKADARQFLRLYFGTSTGSDRVNATYDLVAGTNGAVAVSGGGSTASASMVSEGNGWWRCYLSGYHTNQFNEASFLISTNIGSTSHSGDNTSGLFIWGASLRQSTWNTNYIATTATIAVPGLNNRATAYFDGTAYYLKANAFTWNQPETIILGLKQWTWTGNDTLSDGNSTDGGRIYQNSSSPIFAAYAGSSLGNNNNLAMGTWGAITVVFNGASSRSQVNNTATTTGNAGANNLGGFTLGASGGASLFANIQVSRVIGCNQTNAPPELQFLKWGLLKNANVL